MRLSRRLFSSGHCSTNSVTFSSITEYYDQRKILTEKLLNYLDETNTSMDLLYSQPKHLTLYNCSSELTRIQNVIPEHLSFNKNIDCDQIDLLSTKIAKHKNELLETFKDLENLELKKQRYLTNTVFSRN